MGRAILWCAVVIIYVLCMQFRIGIVGLDLLLVRIIGILVEAVIVASILVWLSLLFEIRRMGESTRSFELRSKLTKLDTFVAVIDAIRIFHYRSRRFRIEHDEPHSGKIIASIQFADYSYKELRTLVPQGRIDYNLTLFVTVSSDKQGGGAIAECDWTVDVDPPISMDEASMVCREVKELILQKLLRLETMRSKTQASRHSEELEDDDTKSEGGRYLDQEESWLEHSGEQSEDIKCARKL